VPLFDSPSVQFRISNGVFDFFFRVASSTHLEAPI
jgi:hypothetical protein